MLVSTDSWWALENEQTDYEKPPQTIKNFGKCLDLLTGSPGSPFGPKIN
jgi:hypothetical protein